MSDDEDQNTRRFVWEPGDVEIEPPTGQQAAAEPPAHALAASPTVRRRARFYEEHVAAAAREHAAEIIGPDLKKAMQAIRAASSYDDLKKRLVEAFKGMDPKRLAALTEKAILMAQAGGHVEAWNET